MNVRESTERLIARIQQHPKSTALICLIQEKEPLKLQDVVSYGQGLRIVLGEWDRLKPQLLEQEDKIDHYDVFCMQRNSAWPLLDLREQNCRIEPGAWIRDEVSLGDQAVVLMGAVLNVGCVIGNQTMIDMNAVVGARAEIGQRCHIGAGAVIAGVLEPASAQPTVIEDDVLIGANAVVLEGVRIGRHAVVAAGAVVTEDIPAGSVAAGMPARVIKQKDQRTEQKTAIQEALRTLK